MPDRTTLKRHADLLDRMAQTVSVDLEEAVLSGDLDPGDLADAVLRCAACPNPKHCTAWLQRQGRTAQATPEYCKNRAMLERLG